MSWYDFACVRGHEMEALVSETTGHIAWALTAATQAMLIGDHGKPADAAIRPALRQWAFNTSSARKHPTTWLRARWLCRNTAPVSTLAVPANARRVLDAATTNADGSRPRQARTGHARSGERAGLRARARTINVASNPVRALKWTPPKTHRRWTDAVSSTTTGHAVARRCSGSNRAVPGSPRSSPSCITPDSGPRKPSVSARTT